MTHTSTEQPEALRLAGRMEWYCISHTIDADMKDGAKELRRLHARVQELEAAQSRRVPLSDSEIDDAWEGATGWHSFTEETLRTFVRAIEAAHGITQEKQG